MDEENGYWSSPLDIGMITNKKWVNQKKKKLLQKELQKINLKGKSPHEFSCWFSNCHYYWRIYIHRIPCFPNKERLLKVDSIHKAFLQSWSIFMCSSISYWLFLIFVHFDHELLKCCINSGYLTSWILPILASFLTLQRVTWDGHWYEAKQ